jgi:hypothetical protein
MKNQTSHKIAQSIVLFFAIVWACMLFTSCSSSKGMHYNSHLKAKKSGLHHLSNDNAGCGWSK